MIQSITKKEYTPGLFEMLIPPPDPKYLNNYNENTSDRYGLAISNGAGADFGIEGLFAQKQQLIDSKVWLIRYEIDNRYSIKCRNLYEIDKNQCTCRYLINIIGDHLMDKKRVDLEKTIIDLDQEKRREVSSYFRDILFLQKELRESLIEKLEEEQKMNFMNNSEVD